MLTVVAIQHTMWYNLMEICLKYDLRKSMSKKTEGTEKQSKKGKAGLVVVLVVLIGLGLVSGL